METHMDIDVVREDLQAVFGQQLFEQYNLLMSSFLSGRITRVEIESSLHHLFSLLARQNTLGKPVKLLLRSPSFADSSFCEADSHKSIDLKSVAQHLHNKYIELVLASLSAAESRAVRHAIANQSQSQCASFYHHHEQRLGLCPGGLATSQNTVLDEEEFQQAIERVSMAENTPPTTSPLHGSSSATGQMAVDADEDGNLTGSGRLGTSSLSRSERLDEAIDAELALIEKMTGRSLLAQFSATGCIPDHETIRHVLNAHMQAFSLDLASVDDEMVSLIQDAMESILTRTIRRALECNVVVAGHQCNTMDEETAAVSRRVLLDRSSFLHAAHMDVISVDEHASLDQI